MKKNILIGTTVSLLIAAFAGPVMATQTQNDPTTLSGLNSIPAQQQSGNQLQQERALLKTDMAELRTLKSQNPVDQAQVDAKTNEIHNLKAQIRKDHPSAIDKLKNILNPRQLGQLGKSIGSHVHKGLSPLRHDLGKLVHGGKTDQTNSKV